VNALDFISDAALAGKAFDAPTWAPWRVALAAIFGLPIADADLELFRACTGRERPPTVQVREAWLIVGRRGGKSMVAAAIAVFLAVVFGVLRRGKDFGPGELGVVMVLASDRRQAQQILRYAKGLIELSPMLVKEASDATTESIRLGRVVIEIHTSSFRAVRGFTIVGAICDEVAFWRDDTSANPDEEIVAALEPGMATIPGALLLGLSTPYWRRGVLWSKYQAHHGRESDVLVWKAPTRVMNAGVLQALIDRALEEDEPRARAEYMAEFRTDIEAFLSRDVVEACVVPERRELPALPGARYVAFCDPSGGASDSFTLAIGHEDERRVIVDVLRERRAPFSPEDVVREFAELLRAYRLSTVTGDRYAAAWCSERFQVHGIRYQPADRAKSDLYAAALAAFNGARVEIPDDRKLVAQLCSLERRTARGGRDSIDHARGAHDDLANAVAGLVSELTARKRSVTFAELYPARAKAEVWEKVGEAGG